MTWVRPTTAPVPTVWRRFNGRRSASAAAPPPAFVIQDIPEDMFEDAVDFMCDNFVLDEPLCRAVDMINDPEAMAAIRGMWFKALEDRLSLVCLLQQPGAGAGRAGRARGAPTPAQPPVIVGVNILVHTAKDHKDPEVRPGSLFFRVISSVLHVTHEVDVFTQYGVAEYLGALGLSVARDYRGQNIGVEILKARVPLCKAVGFSLTATVFTAVESQVLAAKCGFVEVGEVSYQFLADTYIFPMKGITTVSMKYMALPIR